MIAAVGQSSSTLEVTFEQWRAFFEQELEGGVPRPSASRVNFVDASRNRRTDTGMIGGSKSQAFARPVAARSADVSEPNPTNGLLQGPRAIYLTMSVWHGVRIETSKCPEL